MAKFYIQSGSVSLIISANQAGQAAYWGVKRTLDMYFPVDDVELRLVTDDSIHYVLKGLAELDAQVAVSQIGQGRSEAGLFETETLLETWRRRSSVLGFQFGQLGLNHVSPQEIDNGEA